MNEDLLKQRVQRKILIASLILLIAKFIAYFLTHSVGVLTDALESIVNVVAGAISLYGLYLASRPKDDDHPYGHGKVELISASIEGLLIIMAGVIIIFEGTKRIFHPEIIQKLDIGILIVAAAGLINYLLGQYSIRVGKKYDSIALVASGKHLCSDTYSSIGLTVGLILLYVTKLHWIDSALALIFGVIIAWTGIHILRKTVANLMDEADTSKLDKALESLSENRLPDWIDVHNLKIVKYGSHLHIDCDLTMPWYYTIEQGHELSAKLQEQLRHSFGSEVSFSLHFDPCKEAQCAHCLLAECTHRKHPFDSIQPLTIKDITKSEEQQLATPSIISSSR